LKGKEIELTAEQKMIQEQLTLRAVVWDIQQIEADAARLDQEMQIFQIDKILLPKIQCVQRSSCNSRVPNCRIKYIKRGIPYRKRYPLCCIRYAEAAESLRKLGISEKEALLVTEDVWMAEYVYGKRSGQPVWDSGIGVVYYEKEGSRRDISTDMIVQGFEEIGVQFLDRIQKRRNHLPWNILYTERTCVREITMADLDELYLLYEGEGITDYTEPLYERGKEEEYTRSYIDHMYYYYGYGMWVVRDRKTGALIGRAGIDHREVDGKVLMELGYIIGREYQNKGYATEVCRAVMEYAREQLEAEELHCFIHPNNRVSMHLAIKLGFQKIADSDPGQEGLVHFKKCMK